MTSHVYVSQIGQYRDGFRIRHIDTATGLISTIVGPGTVVEGEPGERRYVRGPDHPVLDGRGGLIFADNGGRVLRLDLKSGVVRVVAGSTRGDSGDDGPATRARFKGISGLAIGPTGDIFVADYYANRVRRIDHQTNVITTVVGNGGPEQKPWFTDGEVMYPSAPQEVCRNEPSPPALNVRLEDKKTGNEYFPGAVLRLVNADELSAHGVVDVQSLPSIDIREVTLHAPRSGDYAVFVLAPTYLPEVRGVRLSSGCTGRIDVILTPSG